MVEQRGVLAKISSLSMGEEEGRGDFEKI